MQYSVFNDLTWLFPDSAHSETKNVMLEAPRGGSAGAQILCDLPKENVHVHFEWESAQGPFVELFELRPVVVNENTSPKLMTTTNYKSCKEYVTRKAPFSVYDALCPINEAQLSGRTALYLCVDVDEKINAGVYSGHVVFTCDHTEIQRVALTCTVRKALVPSLKEAKFSMLNFFDYDNIPAQHGAEKNSEAYWEIFRDYVKKQCIMRCTHILLPAGEAVFQGDKLIGFDFSMAERAGQIAIEEGAPYLCGGHVAHWHAWDSSEYYPNWDNKTGIRTSEGYLQMRMYFSQWAEVVERNGWLSCMTQALADEPQTYNDDTYRILAVMFRKFLPNVRIIDAVETTNLGGGIDVWVPKQDTYEKWRDAYETLKKAGEEMWFYTCAFPAGRIMNRSMDLPLIVSRAVLWMGAKYQLTGFLHWGFNYYIGEDIWNSACCPHKGALLPAGDAHVVYPGKNGAWRSMRFEAQRTGAQECELFMQAMKMDEEKTLNIIHSVCTSFRDYVTDGAVLLNARKALFDLLDA